MNNPRLPLPSPWMTAQQLSGPEPLKKTTFEIEGKTGTGSIEMEAVINMKSEDCKDATIHLTKNRSHDVTEDSFTSYFFFARRSSEPTSTPLACIRKYDNTEISLMKKFILYFSKNDYKDVFEEHEHCNLTKGRGLTKQDPYFNRTIERSIYDDAGQEYRTAEGYTGVSYHKRNKDATNKYVSGSTTKLPTVHATYHEGGTIAQISASLDDMFIKAHYNHEGNIWAVDLGGNRVKLNTDKFMYNISTTMVKYYSEPSNMYTYYTNNERSANTSVCTKGAIGFISKDRFESCNPFASKNEEFIVNKIYEKAMNECIPEEIKNHIFNKSSLFSVRKITTMNSNCCNYYQIAYDNPDDEVKYNSFYNRNAMPIYISYSYTQSDGKHIEVKNCYDTYIPTCTKEIVCETMTETSPDKSHVKITNIVGNTTVTKEINYIDPDDRSKTTFKINIESIINDYHRIAKFLGDVIEGTGTIDLNEYLDAVDVYIDTENMSRITVPVPESIYTVFNSLIEATMDHSTMVVPVTSFPYGKHNYAYFRTNDLIEHLIDPNKIDSWVRGSISCFHGDEKIGRYLQIFNHINFDSFILPKEEAEALVERVDKLFPDEDGEGDDFDGYFD